MKIRLDDPGNLETKMDLWIFSIVRTREVSASISAVIDLDRWLQISIPRSAITSAEKREAGRPSWALTPAEPTFHLPGIGTLEVTLSRKIPSAIGERQMFAVQIKRTECIDVAGSTDI